MTSPCHTNTNPAGVTADDTASAFWDRVYTGRTTPSDGRPSLVLMRFGINARLLEPEILSQLPIRHKDGARSGKLTD
ncbi:hypothetical protein [Hoeflea olei]|uniref:Uncharacterized protein n=1 Tax=Hoeflea olei TaxID=1480615 RepID=A0A1C1Z007_9HYPH|nr:hypothetical protein [Hoeflea olei]OCW59062.1 hypothetical protein AWJ14_05010 [Hoeflea olei]